MRSSDLRDHRLIVGWARCQSGQPGRSRRRRRPRGRTPSSQRGRGIARLRRLERLTPFAIASTPVSAVRPGCEGAHHEERREQLHRHDRLARAGAEVTREASAPPVARRTEAGDEHGRKPNDEQVGRYRRMLVPASRSPRRLIAGHHHDRDRLPFRRDTAPGTAGQRSPRAHRPRCSPRPSGRSRSAAPQRQPIPATARGSPAPPSRYRRPVGTRGRSGGTRARPRSAAR